MVFVLMELMLCNHRGSVPVVCMLMICYGAMYCYNNIYRIEEEKFHFFLTMLFLLKHFSEINVQNTIDHTSCE